MTKVLSTSMPRRMLVSLYDRRTMEVYSPVGSASRRPWQTAAADEGGTTVTCKVRGSSRRANVLSAATDRLRVPTGVMNTAGNFEKDLLTECSSSFTRKEAVTSTCPEGAQFICTCKAEGNRSASSGAIQSCTGDVL